ncbi:hypothetical protein ECOK1357_5176, partial [Escherichia coli OK1357]
MTSRNNLDYSGLYFVTLRIRAFALRSIWISFSIFFRLSRSSWRKSLTSSASLVSLFATESIQSNGSTT